VTAPEEVAVAAERERRGHSKPITATIRARYGFQDVTAAIALPGGTVATAVTGLADVEVGRGMTPKFAPRHPDRCSHLVLIVPAATLTGRDPVEFTPLQRLVVEQILNSDVWFRAGTSASTAFERIAVPTLIPEVPTLSRAAPMTVSPYLSAHPGISGRIGRNALILRSPEGSGSM